MTYIPEEMRLAVKTGATWLDEVAPGWVEKINLGNLEMKSCAKCILGQVFFGYWNRKESWDDDWADAHGFRVSDGWSAGELAQEYRKLGTAWSDYIEGVV